MATITGSGLTPDSAFARILQVLLAVYSVAVFATLAGSLGAFDAWGGSHSSCAEGQEEGGATQGGSGQKRQLGLLLLAAGALFVALGLGFSVR